MTKQKTKIWTFLYKMASPKTFYRLSRYFMIGFAIAATLLFIYGLIGALILAPADYQQGDAFRIIYIHVPSAFMSLFVFVLMAVCAFLSLVWKIKLADVMIKVSVPLGAWFTLLALITGVLWGKPMWGTYWIWDARLTSELILLFLYMGIMSLQSAFKPGEKARQVIAIFVLIGFIDIPLIHYSVYWWNTLHQGATLSKFAKPDISPSMLYPLLAMIAAFLSYFISLILWRARHEVLWNEKQTSWVAAMIKTKSKVT